jgi:hypothetical protein
MVTQELSGRWPVSLARLLRPRVVLLIYAVLFALYLPVLHPWMMNWGSTAAEQAMALPGDEATSGPTTYLTRAITINAPPERVWPWLVQIGQDRAGFYSNDWLENLFLADMHNASEVRPEWQQRALGDAVPMGDYWVAGEATLLHVTTMESGRMIGNIPGRFVLIPIDDHRTRLLLRETPFVPGARGATLVTVELIWDPMHFVMEQRMLRGIKERAEGQPLVPPVASAAAQVGWALAGLGLLGIFLSRGAYFWPLVPLGFAISQLLVTRDPNAATAGFLAVGITIAGALVFGRRWWPAYALVAAGAALVLLLAPDAYAAFGLIFDLILAAAAIATIRRRGEQASVGRRPLGIAA